MSAADIRIGGDRPWDVRILDPRVYRRVLLHGMTGLGDAYVDGWWECDAIDELTARALRAGLPERFRWTPDAVLTCWKERLFNLQALRPASRNARRHYDLGNDLFEAMLDPRMQYSCGYWARAASLEDAQRDKIDLVCRKLGLSRGMSFLDIGCGWGGLIRHAAAEYGCRAVGITLSPRQADYAAESCRGLPVEVRLCDYRRISGTFDRIASVGMFEHVGPKNYGAFMRAAERALAPDGLFVLHFFAARRSFPNRLDSEVNWITRHVFPGIVIPSLRQVGAAVEGRFIVEDLHNFGADYDPTLLAWFRRFDDAWPRLKDRYGERFYRMWKYYLHYAAGGFRSRKYQVWQIVMSRRGVPGGYRAAR